MAIEILPAIDLKGGRCVRLRQGREDEVTVYGDDPVDMAKHWQNEGGTYLHVVDLDGAFQGAPAHTEVIGRIVAALDIPVEVGGGIRNDEHVQQLVDVGVDRVILGTRAYAEPGALAGLVERFGAHIAVGIDARDGLVQVKGWVETTEMKASSSNMWSMKGMPVDTDDLPVPSRLISIEISVSRVFRDSFAVRFFAAISAPENRFPPPYRVALVSQVRSSREASNRRSISSSSPTVIRTKPPVRSPLK